MKAIVYDRSIYVSEPETLVARSVEEYTVQFEFGESWDGYATVAVFKTQDGTLKEVLTVNGSAVIPWEVLQEPGVLYIGVYGTKTGKFRPTVWSEPQTVYDGAEEGDPAASPETTPWQQALEQMDADATTAQAAAQAAVISAASGPKIMGNTWYVWDTELEEYVSTGVSATVPGPDGYSPTVDIVKEGKRTTVTITDKTGPHIATILDGADGTSSQGNGDMTKAVYDTNEDGIVNDSDRLAGQLPSYYAKASDLPTKVSQLQNDSGFLTGSVARTVNGNSPNANGAVTIPVDTAPVSGSTNPVQSGGVASAIQSAKSAAIQAAGTAADAAYVAKAGSEMTGNLAIAKTQPGLYFKKTTGGEVVGGIYHVVDSGGNNRVVLNQRTDGSTAAEGFFLPVPGEHSAFTAYNLLTTKNAVTVAQGGTGATTAAAARENLGIGDSLYKSAASGDPMEYVFSGACVFVILTSGYAVNSRGAIFGSCNASGTISHTEFAASGGTYGITVAPTTNKLTITNGSAYSACAVFMKLTGTMPT